MRVTKLATGMFGFAALCIGYLGGAKSAMACDLKATYPQLFHMDPMIDLRAEFLDH